MRTLYYPKWRVWRAHVTQLLPGLWTELGIVAQDQTKWSMFDSAIFHASYCNSVQCKVGHLEDLADFVDQVDLLLRRPGSTDISLTY